MILKLAAELCNFRIVNILLNCVLQMKICIIGSPAENIEELKKIPKKGIESIFVTGDLAKWKARRMDYYISSIKMVEYLSKFAPVYTTFGERECFYSHLLKKMKEPLYLCETLRNLNEVHVINNESKIFDEFKFGFLKYTNDKSKINRCFGSLKNVEFLISGQNPFLSEKILRYVEEEMPLQLFFGSSLISKRFRKMGRTEVYNLGEAGYKILEI